MKQMVCSRLAVILTLLIYDTLGWSFQHRPPTQRQPHNQRHQEQHRTLAIHLYLRIPKIIKSNLHPAQQSTTVLHLNSDNGYGDDRKSFQPGVEDQETLLRISLSVNPKAEGVDHECDDILDIFQAFIQSFPFAAVLPVQPLTYKPRGKDGLKGVDVVFLRKKTMEKGSEDGGISFYLENVSDGDDKNTERRVDITAVRNAEGQFVSKVFSEGVIIKAFTKRFCERLERNDVHEVLPSETGSSGGVSDDLSQKVSVNSIYHKWM